MTGNLARIRILFLTSEQGMKEGRGLTQNESETELVVCGQSYTCEYGLCKDVNLLGDYLEGCSDMTNKSLRGYVVRGL